MRFQLSSHPIALGLVVGLMLAGSVRAAPPAANGTPPTQRTVKLLTPANESDARYIWITAAEGGPPVKLLLTGDAKQKYSALFQHKGELIDITVKPGGQATDMVTSVSKFNGPAGMKSPRAYLFQGTDERKLGTQPQTVVKLSRFGQTKEAVIPNRPGPGGRPAPDPVLFERVKSFKNGDCVEVELGAGVGRDALKLLDIDIYREPVFGEVVKAEMVKVGTRPAQAIVLSVADENKTFLLPWRLPLSPRAQAIVTLARKLKPGNCVLFTAGEDGDHSTLSSLRLDGAMRVGPGGEGNEFEVTFMTVRFYTDGAETSAYFYPRRNGRPDDGVIDAGLRKALYIKANAERLNLKPNQVERLKKILNDNPQYRLPEDVRVRERSMWSKAYAAWQNARDDAERERIEQEMALAAQELSKHWQEEAEGRLTLLKSFLNDQQLAQVREMGTRPEMPLE
jgi:hypothetical protein